MSETESNSTNNSTSDIEVNHLSEGLELSSGKTYNVSFVSATGVLAGFLLDEDMMEFLPDYPYEIYDGSQKIHEGKTDENGFFMHPDIPADYYVLKANGEEHPIVTIQEDDQPLLIGILNEEGEVPPENDGDKSGD